MTDTNPDVPLLGDAILSKQELSDITGIPVSEIGDAFDPEED